MTPGLQLAVEGPIGVGKTTLARRLAGTFGADLLLERPEDNPFLPRFYRDPAAALPTQLCFLLQRAGQVESLRQRDLFRPGQVADFLFDKDRLFAELTLDAADYALYRQVFERLRWDLPPPDCVVYLHAPVPLLCERIARRGRDYEGSIDPAYLQRLADAYGRFFRAYRGTRLIEVDVGQLDLLHEPGHYPALVSAIRDGGAAHLRLPAGSLL